MNKKEIKDIKKILFKKSFKVAIFGSARIKEGRPSYKRIYNLARMIGLRNLDLVTGGGPGLMQAANKGHADGKHSLYTKSISLSINIPNEKIKSHADIEKNFTKFSDRLDNFITLANAVVVAPGGVGTLLELFYTWQLLQTKKIRHIPVILLGDMWVDFMKWLKDSPLKKGYIDNMDMKLVHVARNEEEAIEIIDNEFMKYIKKNKLKIY